VLYSTNAWDPITEDIVLQALHLLVQPSTYPVLVMCNLGRHRTGTVIGCLRKLQKWCLSAILEEYRRYAGQKVRVMNEQVSSWAFLCICYTVLRMQNSLSSSLTKNWCLGRATKRMHQARKCIIFISFKLLIQLCGVLFSYFLHDDERGWERMSKRG
jgi:hypothetical protein